MMNLKPETILKRAGGIEIRLDSVHEVKIIVGGASLSLYNRVLAILEIFAEPLSIRRAQRKFEAKGAQDWIELTYTINALYKIGALRAESEIKFMPDRDPFSFGSTPVHIAMLNDRTRTESFIKAIGETIQNGDIVLEIGTGTGVLAIAAARAGAAKVYTIEAGAMADAAQEIINQNGVADKITVLRGWSTQIELPEKADVLIGEIIGDDPFAERVLQNFTDARRRMLKPNARILPGKIKVFGLPVKLSSSMLRNNVLGDESLNDWRNWYGVDFSALRASESDFSEPVFTLNAKRAKQLKIAGEPLLLTEIDFQSFRDLEIENRIFSKLEQKFNGLLVYFELALGADKLTTHPQFSDESNSWATPVWYLKELEEKEIGDDFTIRYSYGDKGKHSEIRLV